MKMRFVVSGLRSRKLGGLAEAVCTVARGFPGGTSGKDLLANAGDKRDAGQEDPLQEGTATHSSILAWRIQWTEELGRLQSMQ